MSDAYHQATRIAIIGAGRVGSTFAYTALVRGLAAEIVLIDQDQDRAAGEAMDLSHAVPHGQPSRVWAGTYADCASAAVTVVTAGAAQRPGESRLALAGRNLAMLGAIIPRFTAADGTGVLLIASNPVDVLTRAALSLSGFPPQRVVGSGTILDTARLRTLLGRHYRIDPRSVHAYILGKHGDSAVAAWSLASVAGRRLEEFCRANGMTCDWPAMEEMAGQARRAAYDIIARKGATHYAIGAGLAAIVAAILRDEKRVLTVSTLVDGDYGVHDVCLSLPVVLGRGGAERRLRLTLSDGERTLLRASAEVLRQSVESQQSSPPAASHGGHGHGK